VKCEGDVLRRESATDKCHCLIAVMHSGFGLEGLGTTETVVVNHKKVQYVRTSDAVQLNFVRRDSERVGGSAHKVISRRDRDLDARNQRK
jgi:hypothetical protein